MFPSSGNPVPPAASPGARSLVSARRFLQAVDRGANRSCRGCGHHPASARNSFLASLCPALPDSTRLTFHTVFTAEAAEVASALLDLILLHDLPKRCTVPSAVLASDSSLLRVLGHC